MPFVRSAWARRLALAGLVGVAAGWFTLTDLGGWAHRAGLDYLFALRNRFAGPTYRAEESPVAIIVIDEETYRTPPLAGLPQVAWTPQLGRILSALAGTEAKEVGLDLVYSTTLDGIEKLRGYDQELLRGMFRLGRPGRLVLGAIDLRGAHIGPHPGQVQAAGGTGNVRILNLLYDYDTVVREHLGLARDLDGDRYTTFVGELARRAGVEPPERFVINYGTGGAAPPVYSFADLWRCAEAGRQDFFDAAFRGKIVLIGSALDNEDRHVPATRFIGSHYDGPTARCTEPAGPAETRDRVDRFTEPGVFIHAAALDTLLMDGMRLRLPPPLRTAAGTGVASALATFAFLNLAPLPGALVLVLVVVAVLAGSLWAMLGGVVLPVATLLLAALLSAAIVYVVRFLEELRARRRSEAEKRRMSERFGRYLAPAIIERLADDPNALSLGGDRRRVTVFFSDLVGYTSISEALKDRPEQLVELVNGYFGVMVAIIERHGGYVDKFIGDAVMAVWGAPLPQESQEMKAVAAALACVAALRRFNDEIVVGRHGLPPIGARIGINTGDAIVGNMGAPERLSYTVTGDTVNLASRLEGANKSYGTAIMIGPETAEAVREGVVLRPLDLLAVKGKRIPVRVYEAVGAAADVGRDALDRIEAYNAALALYAARRFAEAERAFQRLADEDAVAALYLARCRAFEAAPPPADWDGSFGLTEK